MCENKDLLIGYVYDDLAPEERAAFDAHVLTCAECRDEAAALRATRGHLSAWTPSQPDLGFQVVRHSVEPRANVLPFRSRWTQVLRVAAAAVIVLAAASALANLEVRYDSNGLVVRTGWARTAPVAQDFSPASAPASASTATAQPMPATWRADFDDLNRRLRDIEAGIAAQPQHVTVTAANARMSDAEMLRRVREIVSDAESRQDGAVAQRLLQVMQDLDRQRRADYAMLQQSNAQVHGATQAELLKITEWMRANQLEK